MGFPITIAMGCTGYGLIAAWFFRKHSFRPIHITFLFCPLLLLAEPFQKIVGHLFLKSLLKQLEEKKLSAEIPVFVDMLKSALKAGLLPSESIEFVLKRRSWKSRVGPIFQKTVSCGKGGMAFTDSLEVALSEVNPEGMENFLHLLLSSLKTAQESGGDLVLLLGRLHEKIDGAIRLRRRALVVTAQMRLQARVVTWAPLLLSFLVGALSPESISFFFFSWLGRGLLLLMIFLNISGAMFLKKITTIKGL